MSDDEDVVKIATRYASVGDFEAHVHYQIAKARTKEEMIEAEQALEALAVVLKRAHGDRTVRLADVADKKH